MPTILFYTSIKTRVRDQESLMAEYVRNGHQVFFLNQQINNYLPRICEQAGVYYESFRVKESHPIWIKTFCYCWHLIRFSWYNNVKIVYSHLEPANFIAVLSQYFIKARVIVVRHHHDLARQIGFDKSLSYRLTYRLANHIITVSESTKQYMSNEEGINSRKIHTIKLGYDFSIFDRVNQHLVDLIRKPYNNAVVLLTVGRLDNFKRPQISIKVCQALNLAGIETHLLLLGEGDNEVNLKKEVALANMQNRVSFIGFVDNVQDYMKASDWLLHPSISESSCVVVKEAALVELPVMVCKGIGDFDSYLNHNENSILLNKDNFACEAVDVIRMYMNNKEAKCKLGSKLRRDVLTHFDIKSVIHNYDQFHN